MKKRIIMHLLCIVTSCIVLGTQVVLAESQETLHEKKEEVTKQLEEQHSKLEYVQGEISSSVIEIQKLSDTIAQYEQETNELQTKLVSLQENLTQTTASLEKLTQDYNEKQTLLNERLVTLYKAGDTTYLDVLLSSRSLTDFISRYYMITRVAEYDTKLIKKVEEEKQNVEIAKKALEQQKAEVKITKAKAEQSATVLQNTKAVLQNRVNALSEEEKQVTAQIDEFKRQEAEIENQIQAAIAASGEYNIQYTGGKMIWPIAKGGTYITSNYGNREHPIQGITKFHSGIDIGNAGYGAPIVAAADGIVILAGVNGGYGNCVMIKHGDGLVTLYGHGQKILTQVGAQVKQGDLIMEVGSTGVSTGPHLHFEVRVNGSTVNPLTYLTSNGNTIE